MQKWQFQGNTCIIRLLLYRSNTIDYKWLVWISMVMLNLSNTSGSSLKIEDDRLIQDST